MTAKLCKYCNVQMLDGFDEVERKFFEQGTKILHTRERCEAIRNKGGGSGSKGDTGPASATITNLTEALIEMNSKLDQILTILKGQNTFNSNE